MGFKKNKTIIIFFISIINTAIALFLPSIIIDFDLGNKIFNVKNIHMKNIKLTYGCIALSNLLAIFFGAILICKNKHRIETGFYQISRLCEGFHDPYFLGEFPRTSTRFERSSSPRHYL